MIHASIRPTAFRARLALRGAALLLMIASALALAVVPASAQQAADVATARRLAGEGINLFNTGDYAGALERLERAQTLFDAPTHVLFIARAQAKLGRLVESSETYRQLARVTLEAGAPPAFRDAVTQAPKELAELEPTIPLLTIRVEPQPMEGLSLTIDGVAVSNAVIGVERPVNPGRHTVRAFAPGHAPGSAEVELAASAREEVTLRLESDATRRAAAAATAAPPDRQGTHDPTKGPAAPADGDIRPPFIGLMFGLRLGGALTLGNVDGNRTMADYYGPGGVGQINAGVRFPRLLRSLDLGVSVFGNGYALRPGSRLDDLGSRVGTVTNAVVAEEAGLLLTVSGKRHKIAPFGELGLALLHRIVETRDFELDSGIACEESSRWGGTALAFAGGVHFPLGDWLSISPQLNGSVGQFTKLSFSTSTTCPDPVASIEQTIPPANQRTHVLLGLGVGGEVWIGKD